MLLYFLPEGKSKSTIQKQSFHQAVDSGSLPIVSFWQSSRLRPKMKKIEMEQASKVWESKSFDFYPSLQRLSFLFPGGWVDDEILTEFANIVLETFDLKSDYVFLDPLYIQGLPSNSKSAPKTCKYVFFPYHWNRNHWFLFVLETSSGHVLIFDSVPKKDSDYRESVLCLYFLCDKILGIRKLPSKRIFSQCIPPSAEASSWSFPSRQPRNRATYLETYKVVNAWVQNNSCDCGPHVLLFFFYLISNDLTSKMFQSYFNKKIPIFRKLENDFIDKIVRKEVFLTLYVARKRTEEALDVSISDTSFH